MRLCKREFSPYSFVIPFAFLLLCHHCEANEADRTCERELNINDIKMEKAPGETRLQPGTFEDAVAFARDAHGPQMYGSQPYIEHLLSVVEVLTRFGFTDPKLKTAAILHDVIEDTSVTYDDVKKRFGQNVADIVKAVSLPKGVSRAEAFEVVYPVIKRTPGAPIVKLADRISNFESALQKAKEGNDHFVKKYVKEWPHFRDSLQGDLTPTLMIDYLEKLSTI